jgi:hypothetical protein
MAINYVFAIKVLPPVMVFLAALAASLPVVC